MEVALEIEARLVGGAYEAPPDDLPEIDEGLAREAASDEEVKAAFPEDVMSNTQSGLSPIFDTSPPIMLARVNPLSQRVLQRAYGEVAAERGICAGRDDEVDRGVATIEWCGAAWRRDRGRQLDNVFVERVWRSWKYEDVPPEGVCQHA